MDFLSKCPRPKNKTTKKKFVKHTSMEHSPSEKHEADNGEVVEIIPPLWIDPAKEKKLLAKLDLFFIPVIMLVYLSCFLDRTNIGNVKVAGLQESIGASDQQFSTAVSIFYATYVTFETPFAVMLKKLTPKFLLTSLCVVWSLTTIFSGFIQNVGGLYASRLVLGACEAGLFPGLTLYLTMVYRREEQAKRVAYLFSCTAISGAVGGLLAYALLQMDGVGGYAGWRWVYIIEGIFSMIIAVLVWFGLPTNPAEAWFLTSEQKSMMRIRYEMRKQYLGSEEFSWDEVKIALRDPKLYLSGAIQFCQDILLYGFSTFLPAILKSTGYTSLQSNYLTIPVYIFGAICFLLVAVASDKFVLRSPFLLFANVFGIVGYILLLTVHHDGIKYFATFLTAVAVYNGPGINITWLSVNVAPHYRRATSIGFQQTIANTAGIVAGQIYRKSPYRLGHGFSLGALCVAQLLILAKMAYIRMCNKEKNRILRGEIEDTRKVRTGDREPDFRYHL